MRDALTKLLITAANMTRGAPAIEADLIDMWQIVLESDEVEEQWLQPAFVRYLQDATFFPAPAEIIKIVWRLKVEHMEHAALYLEEETPPAKVIAKLEVK